MFSLPGRSEDGCVMDGSTEKDPLIIPDTSAEELAHLLDKICGLYVSLLL